LPIPERRWQQVSLDLITQLPPSDGFDAILVVVDMLSKMVHCVPTHTSATAEKLAVLFFREVVRLHGLPEALVSDRDSRFTGNFWTSLFAALGTKLRMSTPFHPQTDGQTERANRTIEQMLRAYVGTELNDWCRFLPAIEFAINDAKQASTGFSPFFLNSGQDPMTPVRLPEGKIDGVLGTPKASPTRSNPLIYEMRHPESAERHAILTPPPGKNRGHFCSNPYLNICGMLQMELILLGLSGVCFVYHQTLYAVRLIA
jgi:hypothetical protein